MNRSKYNACYDFRKYFLKLTNFRRLEMSAPSPLVANAEIAKNYVRNSNLPDDYKQIYVELLNMSTAATNGFSSEQKIQKMTESIQMLAVTQGMYISSIDAKIEDAIAKANTKQCVDCQAMKHAKQVEQEKHDRELIEEYLRKIGQKPAHAAAKPNCSTQAQAQAGQKLEWMDVLKSILMKPYAYIVLCVMFVSPYSVDVVKTLCTFFSK